jgi:hypothetical protein
MRRKTLSIASAGLPASARHCGGQAGSTGPSAADAGMATALAGASCATGAWRVSMA